MSEYLENKITYNDLVESGLTINKKIVLINSTKYTDEAFDYILELIDRNESIAFVTDLRQIYTHGEYYGGDIWVESLNYFSKYIVSNSDGEVTGTISAEEANSVLQIQGEGGVDIVTEYNALTDSNILHIRYNLTTAVDSSHLVDLGNDIKISLGVDDSNKITIKKHEGANIWFDELPVLEYDTPNKQIDLKIYVKDITKLTNIVVSGSGGVFPTLDHNTMTVSFVAPTNVPVTIYADYIYDGLQGTISAVQQWGFGWYAGISTVNAITFDVLNKKYENSFTDKTVTIKQPLGEYGWFACPKKYNLLFTDADTGLAGGWQKMGTFTKYYNNIEYQTYRTVNAGLGTVNWKITQKQF